jgi:hypothetical protein
LSSGSTTPTALAAPVLEDAAAAAPVFVAGAVDGFLRGGGGVHGGHQAALDAPLVVDDLGDGREAVGGARCVGDDCVLGGQLVMVHAVNDGEIDFLAGSRDQHALGARIKMLLAAGAVGEEAGAFQGDVDAIGTMRQIGRIALGGHMDALAVDDQVVAVHFDGATEGSVDAVALEQQGVGFGVGQIVDRDKLKAAIRPLEDGASDVAPDTPETVDCNLSRHGNKLLLLICCSAI